MKIYSDDVGVLGVGSGSVPLKNEIGNPSISLSQSFLIRQKHNAEVLRAGLLAEAGAMDDHDVFLAN